MRLFVQLSYDGSPFCGWQFQPNVPSVQQEVERALSIAFGEPVTVVGAGRTDTGVNARHYIAHFDVTAWPLEESARILRKINAILPPAIVAEAFYRVADEAHARFDAVSRTYRYFIHTVKDPFARHSCRLWFTPDVAAMNRAAEPMLGRHDFSSFEKTGGANKTSLCTVTEARWVKYVPTHVSLLGYPEDGYWYFRISANRFLRNMVRAVVGSLLELGRSRRDLPWFASLISDADTANRLTRSDAGESVPGHALFLSRIDY